MKTNTKNEKIISKSPVMLIVENKSDKEQFIELFSNTLLDNKNIVIKTGYGIMNNVSYIQNLEQIAVQPYDINLIRLQSENYKQNNQDIKVVSKTKDGCVASTYVDRKFQKTSTHLQEGIIDIEYKATIDKNTTLETTILPRTTIKYTFFN